MKKNEMNFQKDEGKRDWRKKIGVWKKTDGRIINKWKIAGKKKIRRRYKMDEKKIDGWTIIDERKKDERKIDGRKIDWKKILKKGGSEKGTKRQIEE